MPEGERRGKNLRQRRVEQEWRLLQELAARNPETLETIAHRPAVDADEVEVRLHRTCGIREPEDPLRDPRRSHHLRLRFPRFFPTMPIEAYLSEPVFHPNIDPKNGFVCLWTRFSVGDTAVEAVHRVQEIIAWKRFNLESDHLMQPEAAQWLDALGDRAREMLPLHYAPMAELKEFRMEKDRFKLLTELPRRRRLERL